MFKIESLSQCIVVDMLDIYFLDNCVFRVGL